jgi:hypothetical protein
VIDLFFKEVIQKEKLLIAGILDMDQQHYQVAKLRQRAFGDWLENIRKTLE